MPIYMGDDEDKIVNVNKIDMEIGDAVMYRGCDKWHWREPYIEGQWQAQVFLHYVDANGFYAEWKYDKRKSLGISKTENTIQNNQFDVAYVIKNGVSNNFCDNLIKEYSKDETEKEPESQEVQEILYKFKLLDQNERKELMAQLQKLT